MILLSSGEVTRRPLVVASRFILLAIASVLLYFGLGCFSSSRVTEENRIGREPGLSMESFLSSQVY